MSSFRAPAVSNEGRGNKVAVIGRAKVGKSHLIGVLGQRLELRTKYYSADVDVVEVDCTADTADNTAALREARAWVVVTENTLDAFEQLAATLDMQHAPDRRLLLINQTAQGHGDDVHDLCFTDAVFDWCRTHQCEAVARNFGDGTPLSTEDKTALLSMGLLAETEPTGASRVYQALAQTLWEDNSPSSEQCSDAAGEGGEEKAEEKQEEEEEEEEEEANPNTAVLYFHTEDGFPEGVVAHLGGSSHAFEHTIRNKYYSASVGVTVADFSDNSENNIAFTGHHAGIVYCTSDASLDAFLYVQDGVPARTPDTAPEVAVLLCCGAFCTTKLDVASEWCLDNGFELLTIPNLDVPEAVDTTQAHNTTDQDAPEDTILRVNEALEATMWPRMGKGGKDPVEKFFASPPVEDDAVDAVPETKAETEAEEKTTRWCRRWASGRGSQGCELPPGWVLDTATQKSQALQSYRERHEDATLPPGGVDMDDSAEDAVHDYDKLFAEAMFLRNHGSTLNPDERHERAAQVAMQLSGAL